MIEETQAKPIPQLDGRVADRLLMGFSGSVELDRLLDDNLELLERVRLGQDIQVLVTATAIAKGFTHTTTTDDGKASASYQVKLKVASVEPVA